MLFACCSRRQEQDRDPFGPQRRNHLAQERGLAGAGDTGDIHHHIARSPQEARSAALVRAALHHRVLDLALPEMRAEHLPQASLTVASIWRSSWRTRSVVTWPPSPSSRMKAELRA